MCLSITSYEFKIFFRSKAGLDNTQTVVTVIHFTSPPAD